MNSLLEALQDGRLVELPDDRNKERALTILANLIEAIPSVPAGTDVTAAVMLRERAGSTALGKGWACPHARIENEGDLVCAVGGSPSGIEYGAPDGRPVHIMAMYLVPFNQKNAYLREVSGIAKALQAQTDDAIWSNISDLTRVRSALLDMITVASNAAGPEARARMIQLEARQAPPQVSAVTLAGLAVQTLTVVAGPAMKPVVLSQNLELTTLLEAVPDLAGILSRQGFLDVGGWRILSRCTTPYCAERVVFDCLAVKQAPKPGS
jgi:PTS system nitrogen regulatory IIA component